jgi:heme-degrading monooxygenase HmoA
MKQGLIIFFILCNIHFTSGQDEADILVKINDQIEMIDGYIEFETFFLDPEEFLDKMADHGAELNGYYEHERLKKITRKVGTRVADVVTTFYFWNDQLIHVNYKQRPYLETKNASGQRIMDYSSAFTKYESKYYFRNDEELEKKEMGQPLGGMEPEEEFIKYAYKMKALLDNKFYNRDTYEALQGKWLFLQNTDDCLIFEGTIRFNFYNGKFANRLKTRIEDKNILVCFFPMDDRIYRYKIDNLNDNMLTLTDLFSKEEFVYTKVKVE